MKEPSLALIKALAIGYSRVWDNLDKSTEIPET
jgi:hypothetical protein